MRSKLGIGFMILGAVLMIAALSLFLMNTQESQEAGTASSQVVMAMLQDELASPGETVPGIEYQPPEETALPDPFDPEMTEKKIYGYAYVGYISIPSQDLMLPVMSWWSYRHLDIAPCRFSGSTKTDDLIILAHNYPTHFGGLKDLSIGAKVEFHDMDGRIWEYTVEELEILQATDVEAMSSSGYDLTLFTCTYGGANRVTVRCTRVQE